MDAKPSQRKLSGDCPTIIFHNGKPWAALGTPGGHTIGQTVPQMVLNLIEYDMNIGEAINAPRIGFAQPNWLLLEDGIEDSVASELKKRGHQVRVGQRLGNAHGLRAFYDATSKSWRYTGSADRRGGGKAQGF